MFSGLKTYLYHFCVFQLFDIVLENDVAMAVITQEPFDYEIDKIFSEILKI